MIAKKNDEKKKKPEAGNNSEADSTNVDISVIGVGGFGRDAVNRMIDCKLSDVTFIAMDTDAEALEQKSKASYKIYVGKIPGGDPATFLLAAEKNLQEIKNAIREPDVLILVAELSDGTGVGAAFLLAKIARELGTLTIGLVTAPFSFEGKKRKDYAEESLEYLKIYIDAVAVYPLDNLLVYENPGNNMRELFEYCYDTLKENVQTIKRFVSDTFVSDTHVISVDFEDIKSTLSKQGEIFIGFDRSKGEDRVNESYESAVSNSMMNASVPDAKRILN